MSVAGSRAAHAGLVVRPEFERTPLDARTIGQVERPLSFIERLWNVNGVRKAAVVLGFVVLWEVYTRIAGVPGLLFPSFSQTCAAILNAFTDHRMLSKIAFTSSSLLIGYAVGLAVAAVLVFLASISRVWADILVTSFGRNLLYRNLGDGRFENVAPRLGIETPGWNAGASFFDADGDGFADDTMLEVPAVGAAGGPPLPGFLEGPFGPP